MPSRLGEEDQTQIMALVRVYFVRHGETQANRDGIIQGQMDTALNSRGEEQARMVSEALRDVKFSRAYSSDLRRASETATAILEKHEGVELVKEEALRERYMGALEGSTSNGKMDLCMAGAETGPEFCKRAVDWWNTRILGTAVDTRDGEETANVLVTSHGGWIATLVRALVASRKGQTAAGVVLGHCGNASVSVVEVVEKGRGVVVRYGDASHCVEGETLLSNADEHVRG